MKAKIIMLLAAVSLVMLFLQPMWKITLVAPQYPDGVTMYIWIDKLTGSTPGTLQNINILNHYVGMKMIDQDSIPELQYFPWIVAALILLGILIAIRGSARWYLFWGILVAVLGAAGIFDFYLWEYEYGHNLSPDAPIKIEGQAYQPPLIGKKVLLNFVAYSWPWIGGWFIGVGIILSFIAFRLKKGKSEENGQSQEPHLAAASRMAD